jgi:hypothetical protein
MNPSIYAFTPAFTDPNRLADYYYRAAWYLKSPLAQGATVYFMAPGMTPPTSVPDFLAPDLAEIAAPFSTQLRLINSKQQIPFRDRANAHWLCHDATSDPRDSTLMSRLRWRGGRFVNVDHHTNQFASSLWLRLTSNNGAGTTAQLHEAKTRFASVARTCSAPRAFLFGTGPSFDTIDLDALPPGLRIATNSMVANPQVLERLTPQLIVASDPIFHAGPSKYAYEFRCKLVDALERYGAHFLFPMRDVGVYTFHLPPHLRHLLIPIPLTPPGPINQRLGTSLRTATTSNVMTLLLLPLGASLAPELVLGGFDGRPIGDNDYFWQHSSTVQISNEMESIRRAHPAFFAIDYDDYYLTHVDVVRRYLDELECQGRQIKCITNSHVPALQSRFVPPSNLQDPAPRPAVSIIMPNFNSGNFIDGAINSVRQQRDVTYELLVVDDGSSDQSLEIARRHAAQEPAIRVIEQPHAGVSAARNRGLREACGDYCAFLDSDDRLIGTDSLATRLAQAIRAPADTIVAGQVSMRTDDDAPLDAMIGAKHPLTFRAGGFCSANINGLLGRRGVMRQARFQTDRAYGEDCEYLHDLLRRGYTVQPINKPVATYRMSAGSATQQRMRRHVLGVIDLFWNLGKDRLDAAYPPQNRAGISAKRIEREIDCRYAQLIIHSILVGTPIKDICALLQARLTRGASVLHCGGNVESIAIRALRHPRASADLREAVGQRASSIRRAIDLELAPYPRLRPLRSALVAFVALCEKSPDGRARLSAAQINYAAHDTLRRVRRILSRMLQRLSP